MKIKINKKKGNSLFEKAAVIVIALVFLAGAFSPAVGSPNDVYHELNDIVYDTNQMGDDQLSIEEKGFDNPSPLDVNDLWWNTDWQYRKEIMINNEKVDEDLSNFPVLIIRSSDGDLASHALDNGSDIGNIVTVHS